MSQAERHCFDITLKLRNLGTQNPIDFVLPVWTPGAYRIEEFEKNLISFKAYDEKGDLDHSKLSKNVWQVIPRGRQLIVNYQVYAFERNTSKSYLDSEHAILNFVTMLVYPQGYEQNKAIVRLLPRSYAKNVSTSLTKIKNDPPTFEAENYDVLVDSPVMVGDFEIHSFDCGGKIHEVAIFGGEDVDSKRLLRDLKRIVTAASRVYRTLPYERYVFLIEIDGDVGDDGMEHSNSTYCLVPRLALATEHGRNRMLGLFCHEFFHLWNVKRMTPIGVTQINYGKESYTKSLWIAEGLTTYYEHLLLRRAKIYSASEFLQNIADLINRYLSTPGRHLQSAEESSYDSWIKFYRPSENSINTEISYYTVGALLGLILDLEIRSATRSRKSLDDVMRTIYQDSYVSKPRNKRGYSDEEFQTSCETISGRNLDGLFKSYVRGANDIPFNDYFDYAGLELVSEQNTNDKEKENAGFLGIKIVPKIEKAIIESTLSSSPAMDGGLYAGDEIIGVDKIRIDKENLRPYIENERRGRNVLLTVNRAGLLKDVSIKLGRKSIRRYQIQKKSSASNDQRLLFKKWALDDWKNKIDYKSVNVLPSVDWLFFKSDYF